MTKNQKQRAVTKPGKIRKAIIITLALYMVYMIALINPLTGPYLQYPYYRVFCGHEPVIATSFMGKSYKTADMRGYRLHSFAELYCSENEALSNGYSK